MKTPSISTHRRVDGQVGEVFSVHATLFSGVKPLLQTLKKVILRVLAASILGPDYKVLTHQSQVAPDPT